MLPRLRRFIEITPANGFGLQGDLIPPSQEHKPECKDERRFVFLSHNSRDQTIIERVLVPILNQQYLDFHLANSSQRAGAMNAYRLEILRSLSRCKYFLVFVTVNSMKSEWVRFEIDWAARHRERENCLVVFGENVKSEMLCDWIRTTPSVSMGENDDALRKLNSTIKRWSS